jgi:hypothetical protein
MSLQAGNLIEAVDEIRALVHGASAQARPAAKSSAHSRPEKAASPAPSSAKALPMDNDFDF